MWHVMAYIVSFSWMLTIQFLPWERGGGRELTSTGWPFSKASIAASNPWAKQANSIELLFVYFLQVLNIPNNLAHFCYKWDIRNHGLWEQDTWLRRISKLAWQHSWSGWCHELKQYLTTVKSLSYKVFGKFKSKFPY